VGRAKAEMMEAVERGWWPLETHVCADCVVDEYLKSLIETNCKSDTCNYCGRQSDKPIAAPTEVIQEAIASAVYYYFNEPTDAGVPWDEDPLIESTDTDDVLMGVGLDCNQDLFDDIAEAFVNSAWVPAAGGHWASSHPHQELSYSWESFVHTVKHETRYFFSNLETDETGEYSPSGFLKRVGALVNELPLVSRLPVGMSLYRVRERRHNDDWQIGTTEMGPPPRSKASAGRMNPAGISYFYLAKELETALAEVLSGPPCIAAHAEFKILSELTVIDLCEILQPSIFDDSFRDVREGLLFIKHFVETISKPVRKDGNEHIDYVPSQVVSEYFAKVFRSVHDQEIHGMVYPSAVQPGGRNVVLFPPRNRQRGLDSLVEFESGETVSYATWADFIQAVQPRESLHMTDGLHDKIHAWRHIPD